jgi:hypothetical protein
MINTKEFIEKLPKVGVTIRDGHNVKRITTLSTYYVQSLMNHSPQVRVVDCMLLMPTIMGGRTFKFKLSGHTFTIQPLLEHADNYEDDPIDQFEKIKGSLNHE